MPISLSLAHYVCAGWFGGLSLLAFGLFGFDKWQAGRKGSRISEWNLWLVSAVGGWPGGLGGILLFRHKSAKTSFKVKFALALGPWLALVWLVGHLMDRHSS